MPRHTLRKAVGPYDLALSLEGAPLRAWNEHVLAYNSSRPSRPSSDVVKSPDCFDEPSNMDLYGQSSPDRPKSPSSSSEQPLENLSDVPETAYNPYEGNPPDPYQTGFAPGPNPYHPNNLYNPFFPGNQNNPFLPGPPYQSNQPFTTLNATNSSNVTSTPRRVSGSGASSASGPSGVSKVAIPRLPAREDSSRVRRRHITRACEHCRQRKIKCSGEDTGCRTCLEYGIICCYTEGKREKARTQVIHLEKNLDSYKNALQKMGQKLGLSDAEIEVALKDASFDLGSDADEPDEEHYYSTSSRALDSIREDFNRDGPTLATGFIGRSSEITWLQEVDWQSRTTRPPRERQTPIAAWNYYMDASVFRRYSPRPDPNGFPTAHVARRLYNTYFAHVHLTFPIIGKAVFDRQFHLVLADPKIHGGNRFRAVLNMVLAIGALFVQLTDSNSGRDERDHSLYFERARTLNMDGTELGHFDLQQIQAKGLASLYLLATGQMNRAWSLCTTAVQGALDLGLHLRDLGSTCDDLKEIKYRVWWSLYTLEHRLSVITGRPSCIHETDYSTPLPIPFDEVQFKETEALRLLASSKDRASQLRGSSTPFKQGGKGQAKYTDCDIQYADPSEALYFLQVVLLTSIGRRAARELYGPQAVHLSWRNTRWTIRRLLDDLNSWVVNLPAVYDFSSIATTPSPHSHTTGLALLFYSTKVVITRPCLYHLDVDDKEEKEPGDFIEVENFNKEHAAQCINAACLLLRFLPEPPDSVDLYSSTPWWCILHFLMQTAAILLLELSFKCEHAPDKAITISMAAKKLSEWLHELSVNEAAPQKALNIYRKLLSQLEEDDDCDDGCDDDSTPRGANARSPVGQAPFVVGEQAYPSFVESQGFVGLLNSESVPDIWDESLVPDDPPPSSHGWVSSEGGMDLDSNRMDQEFW